MSQTNQVNWLLVGTGDIAKKRVAPALAQVKSSKLVSVCDLLPERARTLADEYEVSEVFCDFGKALKETSANAVYLATPVGLHAKQCEQALQAGKHVLVEKPLGLNGPDAARAVEAARDKDLRAGCAYFRRCSDRYAQAKEMLEKGQFGQVVLIRMTYFSWFNPAKDDPKYWRVVKDKGAGGPLADMGSHMFDVLIGLLGMPSKVYAKVSTKVQPYEVEDSSAIIMEMSNGADVLGSFNWNSKTWSHEFEIIGTEAKVKWHPYDAPKIIKTVGRDIQELYLPNAENVHLPLVKDFVQAVQVGRDPIVPLAEAAKSNVLLDAVYRSAETGQEVVL